MCNVNKTNIDTLDEIDSVDIKDLSYRKKLVGKTISTQFKDIKHEKFMAHYLMLTKHFESQHTGNIYKSYWQHDRFIDDIVIRSFIEGVFKTFIASPIIIKRRLNQIFVAFYVTSDDLEIQTLQKIYFLTGFSETLLEKLLSCKTTLELRYFFRPVSN